MYGTPEVPDEATQLRRRLDAAERRLVALEYEVESLRKALARERGETRQAHGCTQ